MGDTYVLDRSTQESARLDLQHKLWTKIIGYLVQPSIRYQLKPGSRIADVGTGTGAFLRDLSKEVSGTCQLDGFDISSDAFPPASSLPSNVAFHVHDAKLPFPDNLKQSYDFINLRLLVCGLEENDWQAVVSNVIELLKPGGSVQWIEGDFLSTTFPCPPNENEESFSKATSKVYDMFKKGNRHKLQYGYSTLKSIFVQHGLQSVDQEILYSDRVLEAREGLTKVSFDGVYGGLRRKSLIDVPGSNGRLSEEMEELFQEVDREISSGVYQRFPIYVTTGTR